MRKCFLALTLCWLPHNWNGLSAYMWMPVMWGQVLCCFMQMEVLNILLAVKLLGEITISLIIQWGRRRPLL